MVWEFHSAKSRSLSSVQSRTVTSGSVHIVYHRTYFLSVAFHRIVCKQLMLRWHFQFLRENHFAVCMQWNSFEQREGCVTKGSMASLLFILIPCLLHHLHWLFYSRFSARKQKRVACRRVSLRFFFSVMGEIVFTLILSSPFFPVCPLHLPSFLSGDRLSVVLMFLICEKQFSESAIHVYCKHCVLSSETGQILERVALKLWNPCPRSSPDKSLSNLSRLALSTRLNWVTPRGPSNLRCSDLAVNGNSLVCDDWFVKVC